MNYLCQLCQEQLKQQKRKVRDIDKQRTDLNYLGEPNLLPVKVTS